MPKVSAYILVKILIGRRCESSSQKGVHLKTLLFQLFQTGRGKLSLPSCHSPWSQMPSEAARWWSISSRRDAGCHAACPRQPARCRAWQRSQIPWPGPRPQVHLHIPGALILLLAFHRARAASRHQIRNKGETVTHILFARQMQTKMFCFWNHKILQFTKNSLRVP